MNEWTIERLLWEGAFAFACVQIKQGKEEASPFIYKKERYKGKYREEEVTWMLSKAKQGKGELETSFSFINGPRNERGRGSALSRLN